MAGVFGELEPGVLGYIPGSVVLPGVPSDGVTLSGSVLPGAPSGGVMVPGAGMLSGVPDSDGVMVPGAVMLSGLVSAGTVVLSGGALGVAAVPPAHRELSGKFWHRIFIPSGDILISVGALVDESLLDWAMGDLLDSATAMLAVSAKDRAVPIMVRDFPIILKLTLTEHSIH